MIRLTGASPFNAQTVEEMLQKNKECSIFYEPKNWSLVTEDAMDLNKKMLERDPAIRISAHDALKHKWFSMELPTTANKINQFPTKYCIYLVKRVSILFQ